MFDFATFANFINVHYNVKRIKVLFVIAAFISLPSVIFAQTDAAGNGYTPYSIYGIGDLVRPGTTYNNSMAGVGIADRNVRFINIVNPAAISAREAKSFMMDFGLENRNTVYKGNAATAAGLDAEGDLKSASNTFNLHHLVISAPIATKGAFKLGVMPYSNVGYDFVAHETNDNLIAEMGDIKYTKSGEGTVYDAFFGAGVTMFKRLSLGADINWYFGSIDRYSKASFTTNSSYRSISSGWNYVVSSFNGKFGMQYEQPLGGASSLTVGATYLMGTKLGGTQTSYAYAVSSSAVDTVRYDISGISNMEIPSEIGVGINFRSSEKIMLEFDWSMQDWSKSSFAETPDVDFASSKAQNFRFGMEYTPNRYDVRYFFNRVTYRGGVYRESSYFSLNGHQIMAEGITLGMSIPISRYYNGISFNVDFGRRGTVKDNLIKERYCIFTVAFNMYDIWFLKSLYN